jgi:dolichol-phosphate mannosyltransferase
VQIEIGKEKREGLYRSAVSVIIPAYNEEKTIGGVISSTAEIMDGLAVPYEIIVVNDGSTDKTG